MPSHGLFGSLLAFAIASPMAAAQEATASEECAAGQYAPALVHVETDSPPAYPDYQGSDPIPAAGVSDPCGLRATDLSGVWVFNGYQAVAYHDARSGDFVMRFTHVDPERDYAATWGYGFGDVILEGRIGRTAETIRLTMQSRFPIGAQRACPQEAFDSLPVHYLELGHDSQGHRQMKVTRIWGNIASQDCRVTRERFLTDLLAETGPEGNP